MVDVEQLLYYGAFISGFSAHSSSNLVLNEDTKPVGIFVVNSDVNEIQETDQTWDSRQHLLTAHEITKGIVLPCGHCDPISPAMIYNPPERRGNTTLQSRDISWQFWNNTDRLVSVASIGDPICRASAYLDTRAMIKILSLGAAVGRSVSGSLDENEVLALYIGAVTGVKDSNPTPLYPFVFPSCGSRS